MPPVPEEEARRTDEAPTNQSTLDLSTVDTRPYRLGRFVGAGSVPVERP